MIHLGMKHMCRRYYTVLALRYENGISALFSKAQYLGDSS